MSNCPTTGESRPSPTGQNGEVRGGTVENQTTETQDEAIDDACDAEELLVEEVSIDGLCGVY